MTRAALYARYSSDRQNERSIADQVSVLSDVAARRGWTVVASWMDAAISGTAMANRPGLLNAVAAGERGEYDVLLVEDEDRIARDEEHQWHVYNRLGAAGVSLSTLSAERVSRMQVAFKSFMAAEYVQVLSQKTRRGMAANAEKGLATGARLYGYRSEPGGAMTIVEEEAAVVRRIFAAFADGDTTREIAAALNAEGVPSPKGGLWNASTISGNRGRAQGFLHNPIYAGVKVYGRVQVVKDRLTGKRRSIPVPPDQHRRVEVPHLAIVEADLWARTRAILDGRSTRDPGERARLRRQPRLLSGLIRCGWCGGAYTSYSQTRLVCGAHREKGPVACANSRMVERADIERRVLEGLRTRLLTPEAVRAYVRAYHAGWERRARDLTADRRPLDRRLGEVERAIQRGVDAILAGADALAVNSRLKALEAEKAEIEAEIARIDRAGQGDPAVTLHPGAAEAYARKVAQLETELAAHAAQGGPADRRVVEAVRDLIDRVEINPASADRGATYAVTLHGTLAAFCEGSSGGSALVAGGGLEPPTCGL